MKRIEAIIKPFQLGDFQEALAGGSGGSFVAILSFNQSVYAAIERSLSLVATPTILGAGNGGT